jgi:Co/Zn/Cd efflux system component
MLIQAIGSLLSGSLALLAALANVLILVVVAAVIFTEAIRRFGSAPEVHTDIMLHAEHEWPQHA